MVEIIKLTEAQMRELKALSEIHHKTVGTFDWSKERAVRLRTGKSLEKLGLVYHANKFSANRYKRWGITEKGILLVNQMAGK